MEVFVFEGTYQLMALPICVLDYCLYPFGRIVMWWGNVLNPVSTGHQPMLILLWRYWPWSFGLRSNITVMVWRIVGSRWCLHTLTLSLDSCFVLLSITTGYKINHLISFLILAIEFIYSFAIILGMMWFN